MKILAALLLGGFASAGAFAVAKPQFNASRIPSRSSRIMVCDLDGDGLKDLVLVEGLKLTLFYQDEKQSFTSEAQQTNHLEGRPCLIWPEKPGRRAEWLFVMSNDGVVALDFTNRATPPAVRQIIRQPTIVPEASQSTNALILPFAAACGSDWPLLLVPTAEGLQVWQHQYEWRKSQVLGQSVDTRQRLSVFDPGYTISCGLNFSVGDLNGDGREDLILRRSEGGRTNTYRVYLQQTNGMFAPEPVLTYSEKIEPRSWLCWADLNRDGAVDMIKSVWLNEPSFLPGLSSGKVVVSIYVAGADGRIPSKPQQIFRKSDWTPAVPILDVDGDGYPDLVLGYSQLDSREGVRKQITAQQLDFCLRFHFNRENARLAGGGAPDSFSREADCQVNVAIHLDQASLLLSGGRREYFERYVKVAGDFNGDGKTDLMVRDHGDTISAYFFLSREKGFSRQADLRFNCPEPIDGWEVRDMNNDGVSDMIVRLGNQHGYRIFVSRK